MNKLAIALVLVIAVVAFEVVSANKKHHYNQGYGHSHILRPGYSHSYGYDDEYDAHSGHYGGAVHHDYPYGYHHGHRGGRRHRHHGGGFGGFEGHKNKFGGVGLHNHFGSHGLSEGSKGSFIGGSKNIGGSFHEDDHNKQSGIHKHQTINNDKLLLKEHNSGVNDVDGFSKSSGHSEGGQFSAGSSGFGGETSSHRLEGGKEIDSDFGAVGGSSSDFSAFV